MDLWTAKCLYGMWQIDSSFPREGTCSLRRTGQATRSSTFLVHSRDSVNCLRQRQSMKNGFISASASGIVQRIEILPIINESIHRSILSNPGAKIVWSTEAVSFMSNVSNTSGEVIGIKSKIEKYLQENNSSGQQAINQIEIDTIISSKPDVSQFYASPVSVECDPHFHSCFKVQFHPTYEYLHLTQRLLPHSRIGQHREGVPLRLHRPPYAHHRDKGRRIGRELAASEP